MIFHSFLYVYLFTGWVSSLAHLPPSLLSPLRTALDYKGKGGVSTTVEFHQTQAPLEWRVGGWWSHGVYLWKKPSVVILPPIFWWKNGKIPFFDGIPMFGAKTIYLRSIQKRRNDVDKLRLHSQKLDIIASYCVS